MGSQDQVWAAFGGINRIEFLKDGGFDVQPVGISPDRQESLLGNLQLYFTGFTRFASEIAKKQIENIGQREKHLTSMAGLVDEALSALENEKRPLREIGELLHDSWQLKRELSDSISTPEIDEIYESAVF